MRLGREVGIALHWNWRLHLKQVGAGERADGDEALHVTVVELMPRIAVEPAQIDVRDDRADAQRLAGKLDPERAPDRAAAPVRADQIAGNDLLFTLRRHDAGGNAVLAGFEIGQPAAELDLMSQFAEPLTHDSLGNELGDHERDQIRRAKRGILRVQHGLCGVAAVRAIHSHRRIDTARRPDAIDNTEIFEYLLCAGLDALSARPAKRALQPVDDAKRYAAPCQFDREREPGGACAANQDVDFSSLFHMELLCALCTYL